MLKFIPPFLRGLICISLYIIILFLGSLLALIASPLQLLNYKACQKTYSAIINFIFDFWSISTNTIMASMMNIEWDVEGTENLKANDWYFIICNHRSWLDILVLFRIFHRKIPLLKFFMKQELLWSLPIAGIACWAMGHPFMKRYTKSYLAKHPEHKGKDIETTRKACVKFKTVPTTIVNFLEGTRFTKEKYTHQQPLYQHLLNPKAGGLAFSFDALAGTMHYVINTTIVYTEPNTTLWRFMCGKVHKIIVRYEVIPFPSALIGNYYEDPTFRAKFQQWVNQLWQQKDNLITELNSNHS